MIKKDNIYSIFFISFVFLSLILMYQILKPFGLIIFFALVFYVVLDPLFIKAMGSSYHKKDKLSIIKRNTLAIIFSLFSLIIFLVPTSLLFYTIINQIINISNIAINFLMKVDISNIIDNNNERINKILQLLPIDISINQILKEAQNIIVSNLSSVSTYLTQNVANILKQTGVFISSFIFMMFSLFFFFLDGEYLKEQVRNILPIEAKYVDRLFNQVSEGIKGIVFGNLFTGIVQGISAFIVYSIFRVENSFTLAFLTIIAAFMPVIGTTIIWLPLGILFMITGSLLKGLIFIVCAWFFITIPDNFVRPLLLGNRIELHPLFIFFAILGGVIFFGLSGIILGPLTFILFFELMKIFNEERHSKANKEKKLRKI